MSTSANAALTSEKRGANKTFGVRLTPELTIAIEKIARRQNKMVSEVIRDILRTNISTEPEPKNDKKVLIVER